MVGAIMDEVTFIELAERAKRDETSLMLLLDKYSPLLKKYSTINGIFYEDLYENMIETTIILIRKMKISNTNKDNASSA